MTGRVAASARRVVGAGGAGTDRRVLVLAAATVLLAGAVRRWLLPLGSLNRDESVYVEFAELLRSGHLTLDAATHLAFRPWASGIVDGRVVLKYAPPWPAVIAVADVVHARWLAAALAAGIAVLLVHHLARLVAVDADPGADADEPSRTGPLAAAVAFGLS